MFQFSAIEVLLEPQRMTTLVGTEGQALIARHRLEDSKRTGVLIWLAPAFHGSSNSVRGQAHGDQLGSAWHRVRHADAAGRVGRRATRIEYPEHAVRPPRLQARSAIGRRKQKYSSTGSPYVPVRKRWLRGPPCADGVA
ncbi:hypothetical protein DL764_008839 [Monosporascus ibericus]|uniref:Uncharacterized protein n=1 Tax=Monosporascus ibericus TaxID=155417 RepID=A0A4Q4SZB3_9PEZI|nr:hypothetical protein DL764_008839 [Monosporascus ibericus]